LENEIGETSRKVDDVLAEPLAISRMTPVVGRTSIAERRRRRLTVGRPSCSLVLKLRPLGSRCINRPTKRALRDALLFCSLGPKERPRECGLGRICGAVGLCEGRHAAPGGTPEGSVTETGEAKEHHSPGRWLGHTGHAILRPVIRGLLRRRPPEIGFLVAQAIRSGPKRLRGCEHFGKLAETHRLCGAPVELGKKVLSLKIFGAPVTSVRRSNRRHHLG
jgi:hypothetical protein